MYLRIVQAISECLHISYASALSHVAVVGELETQARECHKFKTLESLRSVACATGQILWTSLSKTQSAVDFLLEPNGAVQVTVSTDHNKLTLRKIKNACKVGLLSYNSTIHLC